MNKVIRMQGPLPRALVTITGASASGKSTLERLLSVEGSMFERATSCTTRAPRPNEVDGVDYQFIAQNDYRFMRQAGELVEDVLHGDHFYGISRQEVERIALAGKIPLIVCAPSGRNMVQSFAVRHRLRCVSIFVDCDPVVRYERLLRRLYLDLLGRPSGSTAVERVLKAHARRLATVEAIESKWHFESWGYDILIKQFDEANTAAVVSRVAAALLNEVRLTPTESRSQLVVGE